MLLLLFSPSSTRCGDDSDGLLFTLSVDGPATELARCIEKGACGGSVNTRRTDGLTPLLAAIQANNRSTVLVLLEHGASASKADTMNLDPLYWALYKGYYPIADILFAHGVNIDRPNPQGNSPLISAVMRGDLAAATFLLQRGADRTRKSPSGLTAKAVASHNHDKPMIALLSSIALSRADAPLKRRDGPIADSSARDSHDAGSCFTDANAVFAAIQSGRRSFRSCSLAGIDLMGMRLDGLDFQGANLSGCDLRDADMRNCDLSGAILRNAFLHGADLRYARVDNADFGNSMLTASDLRDAVGLSFEQLRSVLNLYKAKLDTETFEIMRRDYPKLFKDPGGAWRAQAKTASKSQ